jgi:hypothetical protein
MNLKDLTTEQLIATYSDIVSLLKERKVIRTRNLVGDLAEYLVINHYNNTPGLPNLQAAPAGTQNVDALSRQGERYSIKATTSNLTGVFYGLNPPNISGQELQKFEYVIIACFDDSYKLTKILELTWALFLEYKGWHKTMNAWNLSITKKLLENCKLVYENIPQKAYTLDEARQKNANAYFPWSQEDDERLELLYCQGKTVKQLTEIFNRNAGAINSRIKKLGLKEKYGK